MAEEEDIMPLPPSCPPQTATTGGRLPSRHTLVKRKFIISQGPIILQVIAWTCTFSAVSSAISFTCRVLPPKTATFLCLVTLCTLSALLTRNIRNNNNDHNKKKEKTETIASTSLCRDQHVQNVQQHAQASYTSTSHQVGTFRMLKLRGFGSSPELRQESPWLTSNGRRRSYDDAHLNNNLDQLHHGHNQENEKAVVRQPLPPPPPLRPLPLRSSLFDKNMKRADKKFLTFWAREKKEKQQEVKKTESLSNSQSLTRKPTLSLPSQSSLRVVTEDLSDDGESSGPVEVFSPISDFDNKGSREKFKLERPQYENEVAPGIRSETDQRRSTGLSVQTEPEIANIQQEPIRSGTLSSSRQIDGLSELLPEAAALNQRILMRGGMGLTKPPESHEWEISTEIYLMDNEFSELPENLRCPVLKALFLNRNSRLRKIPESFFENMPALQILNISRTRIKSLPKSLFQLINLKRLFLNHCELLTKLQPEIGKLRNLEILDLEGTRISNLPKEVQHLTTLICLKLSFDDPVNHRKELSNEVIPSGVLSALARLEELHIDVSPNDKRWNACVVAVASEACGLTTLNTLKFYIPRVELLSRFNWSNPEGESLSLSHFRLTVGHHIKRIMSRTPHDIELEMEQYDRCLKYVNGAGVPEEIKMVLRYSTAFFLDRHTDIKTLSELGCESMMQLIWCMVGECNEIRAIINGDQIGSSPSSEKNIGLTALEYLHIYRMKNLRSIWEGRILENGFTSLKTLTLCTCPQLTTIFSPELHTSFSNLEEVLVDDCPVITSLVSCDNSECETTHFLPKLKKVSLHYLPAMASISNIDSISMPPTVEWMSVYYCPNLLCLPIDKGYNANLKKIKGERSWWEALEWRSTQQHSWDDIFVPVNACD